MLRLKEIREAKGVSRYQLAKKAGLQYRTIPAIENGGDVKLSTLKRLADVYLQISTGLGTGAGIKEERVRA